MFSSISGEVGGSGGNYLLYLLSSHGPPSLMYILSLSRPSNHLSWPSYRPRSMRTQACHVAVNTQYCAAQRAIQTTLLNMIAGLDKPDMGELRVGNTVDVMYVDQNRQGLDDPELSVFMAVTDGAEEVQLGARTVNR